MQLKRACLPANDIDAVLTAFATSSHIYNGYCAPNKYI